MASTRDTVTERVEGITRVAGTSTVSRVEVGIASAGDTVGVKSSVTCEAVHVTSCAATCAGHVVSVVTSTSSVV